MVERDYEEKSKHFWRIDNFFMGYCYENVKVIFVALAMSYFTVFTFMPRIKSSLNLNSNNFFSFNGNKVTRSIWAYRPENAIAFLKKVYRYPKLTYSPSGSWGCRRSFVYFSVFFFSFFRAAIRTAIFSIKSCLGIREFFTALLTIRNLHCWTIPFVAASIHNRVIIRS